MPKGHSRDRFIIRITIGYAVFAALWNRAWPTWTAYAFAIAVSVATLLIRAAMGPALDDRPLLIVFVLPMTVSALLGGLGPGMVATAISALGMGIFLAPSAGPIRPLHSTDLLLLDFLIASGVVVSLISEALHRARRNADTNRRLFDAIVGGTTDAVFVKDRLGRYAMCNEATASFLGVARSQIVGRTDAEVLPRSSADALRATDHAIIEAGSTQTYEQRIVLADGRELTFLVTKGPVRDATGEITGVFGISREISERKRIEQALRLRSSALEAAANAIVITDPQGVIEWVNPAFAQLTGYEPSESLGRNVSELVRSGTQATEACEKLWQTIRSRHVWTGELHNRRKDGTLYDEHETITPVTDEDGQVRHFVAIKQDITERKRAERLQREQAVILEMIARNAPIEQTLEFLVRGIETQAPDILCSVLLFDESNQCLCHGAAPSLPADYNRAVDGLAIGPTAGSCGTAAYRRQTVIVEDIVSDPLWADYQWLVTTTDLRACWSSPIMDAAGTLLGTFAVYSRQPGRPSRKHIELVDVATHTAAICIGCARASKELRESEQRFARIFETSPVAISLQRLGDSRFVDANDAWLRMMGYRREEAIGRTGAELHLLRDSDPQPEKLATLKLGGQIRDLEQSFRRKSGEIFETLYSASVVQIAGQSFVLATLADITLQKRAQRLLENQRQQLEDLVTARTAEIRQHASYLRTLIDNIPYFVWLKDTSGRFLAVNRAHAESSGHQIETVIGKSEFDIWPKESAERNLADDADVMATRRSKSYEQLYAHAKGMMWVQTYRSPVIDRDGIVLGTVGFARDISDQRALEQAHEAARQAAENLARTKSLFLANMSHEIRTPLNGVLGMARIGFQESLGHRSQLTFGRILDSGQLLLAIIDDILDFSKIEAGKLAIESVPLDPGALVDQTVDLIREQADVKGLSLQIRKTDQLPPACLGDPVRLKQVILNLVSNAIKFTRRGAIVVAASREGSDLVFSVTDTGIGITPDQINNLFTPFEQADSSTTRNFGGTGLGLAITKRIVELMAGQIRVRSQPGIGSTFEVRVPFEAAPVRSTPSPAQGALPGPSGNRFAEMKILAAEDGEVNRFVLEAFLRSEGTVPVMVVNGVQAVEQIAENGPNAFDLVLMDIQMPEMDGYEAARRIVDMAPGLPIVGQTAHALTEDRARCLAAGMVDYIAKPIELEKLAEVIHRHTQPGRTRRAS